jgi:hypothetical protein
MDLSNSSCLLQSSESMDCIDIDDSLLVILTTLITLYTRDPKARVRILDVAGSE